MSGWWDESKTQNRVYAGTKLDLEGIQTDSVPIKLVWIIDLPFSVIVDSFLLPFDVHRWHKQQPPKPDWAGLGYTPITRNVLQRTAPAAGQVMTNFLGLRLVWIPAGEFDRSNTSLSPDSDHRIRISRGYWIGQFKVTRAQYKAIMNQQPWFRTGSSVSDDLPATHLDRFDAEYFCRRLSKKEHVTYRLPTEAEWEYALTLAKRCDVRDLTGGSWEWCSDWYDKEYYALSPEKVDPKGPAASRDGIMGVLRGGVDQPRTRYGHSPYWASGGSGKGFTFRIVVEDFRK